MKTVGKTGGPTSAFSRISGIAGIGFAVLIVLGNVLLVPAGLPRTGTTTDEVITFFATGSGADAVALATVLTPLTWILATVFGAGAVATLWRSERERGEAWSLVGVAGVLLQNGAFAAVVALRLALATSTEEDDRATAGLWALHDALFTLNGTFLALALLGLTLAGLRSGLIHRWHGGLGLLAAALLFGSATLAPLVVDHTGPLGLLGLAGWLLWVGWLVVYGITLTRNPVDAPVAGSAGSRHGTCYLAPVRPPDHHPTP